MSYPAAVDSTRDSTGLDSARLDSRPFALRLGAHPLFSAWLSRRVSPLAAAALILTCRLSSFRNAARAKKKRRTKTSNGISPRGCLSPPNQPKPAGGATKAPKGPRTRVALKLPIWGGNSSPATGGKPPPGISPSTPFFLFFSFSSFCDSRNPDYSKRRIRCPSFFSLFVLVAPCRSDRVSIRQS